MVAHGLAAKRRLFHQKQHRIAADLRSKTVYSPLFSCIYYTKTGGNLDFKCIVGMGIGLVEKKATPSLTLYVIKRIKHSQYFSTVSHTGHVRRSCVTIWLQYMADSLR